MINGNPFLSESYGHVSGALDTKSRLDKVKRFNLEECEAALKVDGLQKSVEKAIHSRIRKLTKARARENFKKIASGIYLVRTQAGFNHAIKDWDPGLFYKPEVLAWPRSYPSVVSFSLGYNGGYYVQCNTVHVNKLLDAIKDA